MDLEIIILNEVSQRQIYHLCVQSKKWYKGTYLQNRNRLTGSEKQTKQTSITKGEKGRGGIN